MSEIDPYAGAKLVRRVEVLEQRLAGLKVFLDLQAEDQKLWFGNDVAYVRRGLRTLTELIEDGGTEREG